MAQEGARLLQPRCLRILFFALLLAIPIWQLSLGVAYSHDDDDRRVDNAAELPTGMRITPRASQGAHFSALNPELPGNPGFTAGHAVSTAISPDGKTLLILTSGFNLNYDAQGRLAPEESNEYIFVYDVSSDPPKKVQALQVARAFVGLVWNPKGDEFYVSGGEEDTVHVFALDSSGWKETAPPIALGHKAGLGLEIKPAVAGLAVNDSGTRLVAANYENDSISVIDLMARAKIAELDLRPGKNDPVKKGVPGGEYPFGVAIQGDGKAYVSSVRDREIVVVELGSEYGGPRVAARIPVRGSPNRMILNRAGTRLYVACDNSDSIAIIDAGKEALLAQFPVTAPKAVFANPQGFKGSNPNNLALSPDERTLYVTDGGTNAVAVANLEGDTGTVTGLIPTGWYPNAVSVGRNGQRLYVVNGKSPTGPNQRACRNTTSIQPGALTDCRAANQYDLQLIRAGLLELPTPQASELRALTRQVAQNDHFRAAGQKDRLVSEFLPGKIRHVIYIIKENRSYDQVLGDLERGNGDPSLASLPETISPNHHQLARRFVTLDNFYDSGEVSGDGWNWSTAGRATDSVEKTLPIEYADHGLDYAYEGTNRNINVGIPSAAERHAADPYTPDDDDLLPGTADVSAPDAHGDSDDEEAGAGYLWEDALRAKLTVRNYGFFIDQIRYGLAPNDPQYLPLLRDPRLNSTVVAYPAKLALAPITDPYFRGFDQAFPDYWRYKEWEHEFDGYVKDGNLPALELVRLAHDHFGAFAQAIDGVNTVDTQMADNDYALGLLIEKIAESPYKDNTLIFVVEDDSQDGPDHVDAHRSIAFVAGAYVRQRALVSNRYTTVNMLRTIEDVLGIAPLGLNDSLVEPMTGVFERRLRPWNYAATVPEVLRTTNLPLPATPGNSPQATPLAAPRHDAAYWEDQTKGMDFSVEDRLDTTRFNHVLWYGLMGETVAYPERRDGRDLRHDRKQLLKRPAGRPPAPSSKPAAAAPG